MAIEIRSGGAIAVDPASLRELAQRVDQARGWVETGAGGARTAIDRLWWAPVLGHACGWRVDQLRHRMVLATHELEDLAARIRTTADAYEIVDLLFRVELSWLHHGVHGASGAAERAALEARIREISDADGEASDRARALIAAREEDYGADEQWTAALAGISPAAAAFVRMAAVANRGAGTGVIPRGARLRDSDVRAGATAVSSGTATAPQSLADAASRIPDSDGSAQIRVEKYTMADGTAQFAVYLAGTSDVKTSDVFNWPSNVDLYFGKTSPSFTATMNALADAGARPGDVVHAFGFSQGGMIATRLATEGDYRVETLVGLGSPVDADLGGGTLSLQVRHTDDPIALLAAGGMPGGTGAPQSVVVERIGHPEERGEIVLPAHRLDPYVATVGMVDASDDVRIDAFRDALAELRTSAVHAEFTEYRAELAERRLAETSARGSFSGVSDASSSEGEG